MGLEGIRLTVPWPDRSKPRVPEAQPNHRNGWGMCASPIGVSSVGSSHGFWARHRFAHAATSCRIP
jgi:hypothetical protein